MKNDKFSVKYRVENKHNITPQITNISYATTHGSISMCILIIITVLLLL